MLTYGAAVTYLLIGGWPIPSAEHFHNCPLSGVIENYEERWVWDNPKAKIGHYTYKYLVKFKCAGQDRSLWLEETALSKPK